MPQAFYRGPRVMKGHGFGGTFASLFRRAIPILKTVGKYLGRRALHTGFNTLESVIDGNDPKTALRREMEKTKQRIISDTRSKFMSGKGLKRKRQIDDTPLRDRKRFKYVREDGEDPEAERISSKKKRKMKKTRKKSRPIQKHFGLKIVPRDFFD